MFIIQGGDGKEYGPVAAPAIAEWIRDGRANLQTKARLARESGWKTLADFPEFNPAAAAAPAVPPLLSAVEAEPPAEASTAAVPEHASRWIRLPAAMIDGLLKTICYLPISLPLMRAVMTEAMSGEPKSFAEMTQLTNRIVSENLTHALPFLAVLVLVQFFLLASRGQSVGKLLLRLRIVREADGSPAGPVRAFVLRGVLPFLIEQVPFVGFVFWVIDSGFLLREDHRCLHDHIAGTRVVVA
ncbi:MAG TPA: RDD family protein [Lacunisphaera sp.]|nr:RDD family protein [Lacunisphaera sp.]